jgi:hypothetical protein
MRVDAAGQTIERPASRDPGFCHDRPTVVIVNGAKRGPVRLGMRAFPAVDGFKEPVVHHCGAAEVVPSTEELGEEIAALAARLHAATYELLVLLRDFDARAGWNCGFLSCAHWLHWRTGIDLGASREKVRVARALASLPRVSAAMQRGAISYAKVRALTRVATPDTEASLLDVALAGTAAHVERFVRAWRRVDRVEAAREVEMRHLRRQLSTWIDDDGMVVIRGRLTPEVGAVVQRALDAAADRLYREAALSPSGGALAEEMTFGQRRADALGLLAEAALSADLDRGSAGDRYQVVLHVDASDRARDSWLREPASASDLMVNDCKLDAPTLILPTCTSSDSRQAVQLAADIEPPRFDEVGAPIGEPEPRVFDGALEVDDGAQYVAAETSRRLSCDASVVMMRHDSTGSVLDVGRKTRTIPPAIRRALLARDCRCTFPGCSAGRCDAHHIRHWADGGATGLDNLLLLCRRHHRAVHEGGFAIARQRDGLLRFVRPDGKSLEIAPALPPWPHGRDLGARDLTQHTFAAPLDPETARLAAAGIALDARSISRWDGRPFDLAWAIDIVRDRAATPRRTL